MDKLSVVKSKIRIQELLKTLRFDELRIETHHGEAVGFGFGGG
jgi:hypothetical protein